MKRVMIGIAPFVLALILLSTSFGAKAIHGGAKVGERVQVVAWCDTPEEAEIAGKLSWGPGTPKQLIDYMVNKEVKCISVQVARMLGIIVPARNGEVTEVLHTVSVGDGTITVVKMKDLDIPGEFYTWHYETDLTMPRT